jgi:hypothetical protein
MSESEAAPRPWLGVGLALIAFTLLLSGGSYLLYQAGFPGSPQIENQIRAGPIMIRSRIAALVPPMTSVRTSVEYQLGEKEEEGHRAHIYIPSVMGGTTCG